MRSQPRSCSITPRCRRAPASTVCVHSPATTVHEPCWPSMATAMSRRVPPTPCSHNDSKRLSYSASNKSISLQNQCTEVSLSLLLQHGCHLCCIWLFDFDSVTDNGIFESASGLIADLSSSSRQSLSAGPTSQPESADRRSRAPLPSVGAGHGSSAAAGGARGAWAHPPRRVRAGVQSSSLWPRHL